MTDRITKPSGRSCWAIKFFFFFTFFLLKNNQPDPFVSATRPRLDTNSCLLVAWRKQYYDKSFRGQTIFNSVQCLF